MTSLKIVHLCPKFFQPLDHGRPISNETHRLHQLMFEYDRIKQELQYQMLPIYLMHVSSLFLVSNDKAIPKNDKIHARKLQKLIPNMHEKVLLIMFHMILIKLFIIFQIIILRALINRC